MTRARDMANIAAGSFSIPSGSLSNAVPADGSITTAKLAANAVTDAKLASGAITSAALPAGSVLQVKSAVIDGTDQNTSSSSFQASNITLSITPFSSSSKILVLVSTHAYCDNGIAGAVTIYRGSTNLATYGPEYGMVRLYNAYGTWQSVHISHLDSPATTNSTTYTAYWKNVSGSSLVYLGQSNNESSITLMEIAG